MHPIVRVIARTLFRMGSLGLLTLGIFDSSPLVLPFGNDLLMLALSARHNDRVIYYVAMATLGSLIGCLATDWVSRKGERRLKKILPGKYQESISNLVKKRSAWTLVLGSLMPPPFPFTAVVAATAAFSYPRKKLLGFIAVGRLIRFSIEAGLAIHYGRWIVRQAQSSWLEHVVIAIIVISIAGSAYSIYQRADGQKQPPHRMPETDSARP